MISFKYTYRAGWCRQGSLSIGWSVHHALRLRRACWYGCCPVWPGGIPWQSQQHLFKSCSGKVDRWGSISCGSNGTASSEWAFQGGPGRMPAYDSEGSPGTLLDWTLPRFWCLNLEGNILSTPGYRQQQVRRLCSAVNSTWALPGKSCSLEYMQSS